jgi:hypothetical protein
VVRVAATMAIFDGALHKEVTTGADGRATVMVSSETSGFAQISAANVSDDVPLAAFAGANFWQPEGDSGGLINLEGVPYAFPGLEIRGRPFQQSEPILFNMPMHNSNSYTIHVTVTYGVSGFGLGAGFRPVGEATASIPPGGTWDAPGGWTPGPGEGAGHGCATGDVGWSGGPPGDEDNSGEFERRVNLNLKGPASPPPGLLQKEPGRGRLRIGLGQSGKGQPADFVCPFLGEIKGHARDGDHAGARRAGAASVRGA